MIACYIGGNPDGTNSAYALVEYVHRREFRPEISVRPDIDTALADCQLWLGEVRQAFKQGQRKEK